MEANNGEDCLRYAENQLFDLVILDVNLPGTDALSLTQQLILNNDKLRILIFSMYPSIQYAARFYKAGAKGYISKEADKSELLKAVDLLFNNRIYMEQDFQDIILNSKGDKGKLTEREFAVAQHLAHGMSYKEIARILCIEASSVRTHKKNIFRKLNVNTLFEFLRIFEGDTRSVI